MAPGYVCMARRFVAVSLPGRGGGDRRLIARLVAIAVSLTVVAAACGNSGDDSGDGDAAASGSRATDGTVDGDVRSALAGWPDVDDSFPEPIVDPADLRSGFGGSRAVPDRIPAIDEPKFAPAREIDFLADNEPVLSVRLGDEARAYPVQIMIWHELVNDTVDGSPVAVSYCPLCNSALAFGRQLGDRVLDFGTSGLLHNSALVMYDRQTESLWDHFTGQAIIGELTGEQLEVFPMQTVAWGTWRDANADALVLTRDTGHSRDYGNNPYGGYDDIDSSPFLFDGENDDRLRAMERVVTVRDEDLPPDIRGADGAVAVRQKELVELGVLEVDMGGTRLVFWAEPGTASSLDSGSIAAGQDVGATGVFVPVVDGRELTFERHDDRFVDNETTSGWNLLGRAVDGPLAGTQLEAIPHLNTFWFAWATFEPDTQILP